MSEAPFPPLPDLTFEALVPGSAALARYRDAAGAYRSVERRVPPCPEHPDALPGGDLAGIVARVLAVHARAGEFFLVYEEDFTDVLPARLQDRSWGARDRLRTIASVGRAVEALHARGLVHGDLTPDAILFRHDGSCRLAAISSLPASPAAMTASPGSARTFGPTLNRRRATGGALAYLAPEQFMAATTVPESDVFAWGCLAYEIATGRSPFGFVTDPAKLLDVMTRGPLKPIGALADDFGPGLDDAVRAALAVDRKQRVLPDEIPDAWIVEGAASRRDSSSTAERRGGVATAPVVVALLAALAAVAYFLTRG